MNINSNNIEKLGLLEQELKILKNYLKAEGLSFRNSNEYKRINMAIYRLKKKMDPAYLEVAKSYASPSIIPNLFHLFSNTIPGVPSEQKLAKKNF